MEELLKALAAQRAAAMPNLAALGAAGLQGLAGPEATPALQALAAAQGAAGIQGTASGMPDLAAAQSATGIPTLAAAQGAMALNGAGLTASGLDASALGAAGLGAAGLGAAGLGAAGLGAAGLGAAGLGAAGLGAASLNAAALTGGLDWATLARLSAAGVTGVGADSNIMSSMAASIAAAAGAAGAVPPTGEVDPNAPRGQAAVVVRDGDWVCAQCHNHNFARRNTCNRCQAIKDPLPPDEAERVTTEQKRKLEEAERDRAAGKRLKVPIPCRFESWKPGACKNGADCSFSHDPDVINNAFGEKQEEVPPNAVAPGYKQRYCKFYDSGCARGKTCSFAHGIEELRGELTEENLMLMAEAQELAQKKGTKQISKKSSHKNSWGNWDESENPSQEQNLSKTLETWSQTLAGMGSMKGQNVTMKDLMNWTQTVAPREGAAAEDPVDVQQLDIGGSWDQGWGNSWGSSNSWSSSTGGKQTAKGKSKGVPQAFKSTSFQQRRVGGDGQVAASQLLTPRTLFAPSSGSLGIADSVWPEIEDPTRPKHIPMTTVAFPSKPKIVDPPASLHTLPVHSVDLQALSNAGIQNLEAPKGIEAASSTFEALLG